jgi:hypothetical protein
MAALGVFRYRSAFFRLQREAYDPTMEPLP